MASSRILSRVLVPTKLNRLAVLGNGQGPIRHFFYRNPRNLPDVFLGSTSNMFRDLEREFERMQRQFDHFFRNNASSDNNNNRSLVDYSRGGNNGKFCFDILTKFHLDVFSERYDRHRS